MGKPDAAHLTTHDHPMQVLVSLAMHEEFQHVIAKIVELIFVEALTYRIVSQESKKKRPFVLVVSLFSAKRKR